MALTHWAADCLAPAKLNLFLHVTGRRADGYHTLQSALQLLDWGDRLSFRVRHDGEILRTNDISGVPPESDLAVRAARRLKAWSGCSLGTEITIDKVLPMGGGLGGGSSDAATALLALNRLWGVNASRAQLQTLALELGADVPFFVFGRNAFAEGIGEQLSPLDLPRRWYVVVSPGVKVPTAEIFAAQELTRNTKIIRIAAFAMCATRNDLEPVARSRYPQIGDAIDWLGAFAPARMTGSGACLFAIVEGQEAARKIVRACPPQWRAWAVRSLAEHPLRHFAG